MIISDRSAMTSSRENREQNRTEQRNKTRRDGRRTNQEQEEKGMLALRSIHFSRKREGKGKRRESVESNRSDAPEKEGPKRRKRVRRDIHSILSSPDLLFSLPPLSLSSEQVRREMFLLHSPLLFPSVTTTFLLLNLQEEEIPINEFSRNTRQQTLYNDVKQMELRTPYSLSSSSLDRANSESVSKCYRNMLCIAMFFRFEIQHTHLSSLAIKIHASS